MLGLDADGVFLSVTAGVTRSLSATVASGRVGGASETAAGSVVTSSIVKSLARSEEVSASKRDEGWERA